MPCGDANVKYPRAGRPGRARDSRREPVRSLARAGTFLYVARAVQTALERWPRGRRRRFAKPLYGPKAVSRVRIPPSPPISSRTPRIGFTPQTAVDDGRDVC